MRLLLPVKIEKFVLMVINCLRIILFHLISIMANLVCIVQILRISLILSFSTSPFFFCISSVNAMEVVKDGIHMCEDTSNVDWTNHSSLQNHILDIFLVINWL